MATLKPKPDIVTNTGRCQSIVSDLMKCDVIAMDAEGVQLGKDGPMTLLQIGTLEQQVYLFDVQENKKLFTEGQLRDLLQSPETIKVIHSCSGDSAALYHQFNIRLRGVFDTQIANIVIEEDKGKALAALLKLEDICHKYSTTATVADQKSSLKDLWLKEAGNLWARRPLTKDMIEYAAGDVTALIPEVYENQRRYIREHNLQEKLEERVEEEILISIDEKMLEQRRERVRQTVKRVVTNFVETCSGSIKFSSITDEDVINAFKRINLEEAQAMSLIAERLKSECVTAELDEIERMLAEDASVVVEKRFHYLHYFSRYPDERISNRAKRLQDLINRSHIDIMAKKYSPGAMITYLTEPEKDALKKLRPNGENDRNYPSVVLELYWNLMRAELESTFSKLQRQGKDFRINEGYYKKIKYFMGRNSRVPLDLKKKAKEFIELSDKTFGRNVIPK